MGLEIEKSKGKGKVLLLLAVTAALNKGLELYLELYFLLIESHYTQSSLSNSNMEVLTLKSIRMSATPFLLSYSKEQNVTGLLRAK